MVNLYDLEIKESCDIIQALKSNGETPELAKMRRELEEARHRGVDGHALVDEYLNQKTELGSKLKRYTELESDIRLVMQINELNPELVARAYDILQRRPNCFNDLTNDERKVLTSYWLKKKTCMADLIKRGYTYQELLSIHY